MKTLSLCEALTGLFPSPFHRIRSLKPPSFVLSSSSAPKSLSCCNSFKFADRSCERIKEENPLSGLMHLPTFGEIHDMKFRCIEKSKSLNMEENKDSYFLRDEIRDIIKGHHMQLLLQNLLMEGSLFPSSRIWAILEQAFLLIFFSELGDKTFFIAALLAARNSGAIVFAGTFGALAAMTVVSVVLGRTFHYVDDILPFRLGGTDFPIDDFAAVCLLVYFGVTTLLDAASGDELKLKEEQEELAVLGGSLLGTYVSEKVVAYIGGTLFLVFAGVTFIEIFS